MSPVPSFIFKLDNKKYFWLAVLLDCTCIFMQLIDIKWRNQTKIKQLLLKKKKKKKEKTATNEALISKWLCD